MAKATLQGGPLNGKKVDVSPAQTSFIFEGKDGKKYEYRMAPFAAFQGKTHQQNLRYVGQVREQNKEADGSGQEDNLEEK